MVAKIIKSMLTPLFTQKLLPLHKLFAMDTTKYDFLKCLRTDRFFLLAGPCVIEDETSPLFIAETLKNICQKLDIPLVFKGSYRKANRSRLVDTKAPLNQP